MKAHIHKTINVNGRLLELSTPVVMGILNVTPDSFYAGSRVQTEADIARRADVITEEGGTIIDVGACSTRPGAVMTDEKEEAERVRMALKAVRKVQPDAIISLDTFRPNVAQMAVEEYGVAIINDISGGNDRYGTDEKQDGVPGMFELVARLGVAYVLTSLRSTLQEVLLDFSHNMQMLHDIGAKDIILDPGFGFGKTIIQNYDILNGMDILSETEMPVLVGVSRKSMIYKQLGITPEESQNGTTVLNTVALMKGADILRVHDVREAMQAVKLYTHLQ